MRVSLFSVALAQGRFVKPVPNLLLVNTVLIAINPQPAALSSYLLNNTIISPQSLFQERCDLQLTGVTMNLA